MRKDTRRWTDDQLIAAVKSSVTYSDICKKLGIGARGGSYRVVQRRIKELSIDTSHLLGRRAHAGKERKQSNKIELEDILRRGVYYSSHSLKKRLIRAEIKRDRCEICGAKEWMGETLSLELHHIDGDHTNNELSNLQILCPNCHSLK
jgi:hypothetical protein